MDSLQTKQQQPLTNFFNQCDTNRDEQLDKAELKIAFRRLDAPIPPWRASRALHHADADRNGYISKDEMGGLVQYAAKFPIPPRLTKQLDVLEINQRLKAIFRRYDTNGDGRLNKAELKQAFLYLGSVNPAWRANRALHHSDADRDGFIDEDEMNELVSYAVKMGYTIK